MTYFVNPSIYVRCLVWFWFLWSSISEPWGMEQTPRFSTHFLVLLCIQSNIFQVHSGYVCYIAMENGHWNSGCFPIQDCDFSIVMLVYQRVSYTISHVFQYFQYVPPIPLAEHLLTYLFVPMISTNISTCNQPLFPTVFGGLCAGNTEGSLALLLEQGALLFSGCNLVFFSC